MNADALETGALQYELEVTIDAPTAVVWHAITDETDAWWLADFHMLGEGSVVTLDARAGGNLIEQRDGGGSLLWYTVRMCTPGKSLHLVGHLGPDWGGPATSMLSLTLEARGSSTAVLVRDAVVGRVTEKGAATQQDGWRQLFTDGLKAQVEGN